VIFGDHSATGDGIVTALRVLEILAGVGKPLSELTDTWERYPQVMRNFHITERVALEDDWLNEMILNAKSELGKDHILSLRYSGTEPLLRLTVSSASEQKTISICDRLCEALVEKYGWEEV
jgi:phosphoglucosamine mutase